MKNFKPDYEYRQVNTKEINVDPLYQRDLSKSKVTKIVKKFNPYLVNACKLSFRDGKFWVFDGQHTIAAIKAKNNGNDLMVDCKVFYGLTRIDEMELFIEQNGESTNVRTNERLRALFNNGDKDVVGMVRSCEKVGVKVDFMKGQAHNRINALSTLMKSYKSMTEKQFMNMLLTIKEAWGGVPESFSAEILNGMTRFYIAYDGEFNKNRLKKVLAKTSPVAIIRDGKVSATGGNAKYARVILGIYNRHTSIGKLEDKL